MNTVPPLGRIFYSLYWVFVRSMKGVKISVVIPTYKRPALLVRCLDAVLNQRMPNKNFEVIVVSDGNDQATRTALASRLTPALPAVRYYALPAKAGPAAARNLGWMSARGHLIVFTDDDCIPSDNWLSAMWAAFLNRGVGGAVALSGRTIVPVGRHPTDYEKNISRLQTAEFITANCASTREALQHVGGFDERFRMAWREDSDLQFKFMMNGIPIYRVEGAVVTHPVRKARWGVSIFEEKKGMFNALLYKKYPRLYREKIAGPTPWHYYGIVFFLLMCFAGIIADRSVITFVGLSGWLVMTAWFTCQRLRAASRAWDHVLEMVFTSAVIPLLSLFWSFYGAWKFRTLRRSGEWPDGNTSVAI